MADHSFRAHPHELNDLRAGRLSLIVRPAVFAPYVPGDVLIVLPRRSIPLYADCDEAYRLVVVSIECKPPCPEYVWDRACVWLIYVAVEAAGGQSYE